LRFERTRQRGFAPVTHFLRNDLQRAFLEQRFLRKTDTPDDDQLVPIDANARASAALVKRAKLIVYEGGPHGITDTHKDRLNQDLLSFLRE
jgi:pimeloyl-ACP methyl ester carboxylesterase